VLWSLGEKGKLLELKVSGGFWGRNDKLEVYLDGSFEYQDFRTSSRRGSTIPSFLLEELKERLNLLLEKYPEGLKLGAKGGADYFIYNMSVYRDGRVVTYYWTDVSEGIPVELSHLDSLLRSVLGFASGTWKITLYAKVDKLHASEGETLKVLVIAVNPGPDDFSYPSPTPCSPDFKVLLRNPNGEVKELFPQGYDPGKPCIQVIQNRTLKAGGTIRLEYTYSLSEEGVYTVEAYFPYAEWSEVRYAVALKISVS